MSVGSCCLFWSGFTHRYTHTHTHSHIQTNKPENRKRKRNVFRPDSCLNWSLLQLQRRQQQQQQQQQKQQQSLHRRSETSFLQSEQGANCPPRRPSGPVCTLIPALFLQVCTTAAVCTGPVPPPPSSPTRLRGWPGAELALRRAQTWATRVHLTTSCIPTRRGCATRCERHDTFHWAARTRCSRC